MDLIPPSGEASPSQLETLMEIYSNLFLQVILFVYNSIGFQNLGVAIIEIAVISRIIFYPLAKQQAHYSKKMGDLQPHLSALKEKHKGNQQAYAAAQMALFKEHGVNPAGGCLPAIVQIALLFGLLGAMNSILVMKNINTEFLFWDMAKPDAIKIPDVPFALPGVLVIVAAATQYVQTKMMMPMKAPKKEIKPASAKGSGEVKKGDFMSEFADAQTSMVWMFPLIFLFLGTQWPSGLALFWTISSTLAIVQQYRITGLGALQQDVLKLKSLLNR